MHRLLFRFRSKTFMRETQVTWTSLAHHSSSLFNCCLKQVSGEAHRGPKWNNRLSVEGKVRVLAPSLLVLLAVPSLLVLRLAASSGPNARYPK